jgi:hypothetical protein
MKLRYDLCVWLGATEPDDQVLTLVEFNDAGNAPRAIGIERNGTVRLLLPKAGLTSVFPFPYPDPEAPEDDEFQTYQITEHDFLRHLERVTEVDIV